MSYYYIGVNRGVRQIDFSPVVDSDQKAQFFASVRGSEEREQKNSTRLTLHSTQLELFKFRLSANPHQYHSYSQPFRHFAHSASSIPVYFIFLTFFIRLLLVGLDIFSLRYFSIPLIVRITLPPLQHFITKLRQHDIAIGPYSIISQPRNNTSAHLRHSDEAQQWHRGTYLRSSAPYHLLAFDPLLFQVSAPPCHNDTVKWTLSLQGGYS